MKLRRLPISYTYIIIIAIVLCAILFLESYISFIAWKKESTTFPLAIYLTVPISNYLTWIILIKLVYHNLHSYPLTKPFQSRTFFMHLSVALGIVFIHVLISLLLYFCVMYPLGYFPFDEPGGRFPFEDQWLSLFLDYIGNNIPGDFIIRFIEYWVIVSIFLAIDFYQGFNQKKLELVNKEKELSLAQLRALKMQLQPHFLFNALNTVSSLMDNNIKEAQTVLARFGDLLRIMLKQNQGSFHTLDKELEYIQNYLEIEQIRFHDRLHINYEIDNDTLKAEVPVMILQPLAENAIKHGFAEQSKQCTISLVSKRKYSKLMLIIEDNGNGCENTRNVLDHPGIGIKNSIARLNQLYKNDYEFNIDSNLYKGFKVTMLLPFKLFKSPEM